MWIWFLVTWHPSSLSFIYPKPCWPDPLSFVALGSNMRTVDPTPSPSSFSGPRKKTPIQFRNGILNMPRAISRVSNVKLIEICRKSCLLLFLICPTSVVQFKSLGLFITKEDRMSWESIHACWILTSVDTRGSPQRLTRNSGSRNNWIGCQHGSCGKVAIKISRA